MPRRLRVQYPNAIYHVIARGNGRQDIVCDDDDRERLIRSLARSVERQGWHVFAFVVLSKHLHVVLKTPQPSLAQGMQSFLESLRQRVQKSPPRERRRETRRLLALDLERISAVAATFQGVAPSELSRRGSRHPARAAVAYLGRRYTSATNGDRVPVLGVSRPESVPNLKRRFDTWVRTQPAVREPLMQLEERLGLSEFEKTIKQVSPQGSLLGSASDSDSLTAGATS